MNQVQILFYWLTIAGEILLCGFVFSSGVRRILPLFATYSFVILAGTMCIGLAYVFFGYRSDRSFYIYWATVFLYLIARSLAIAELCRYGLRAYRGIWALAWRALSVLALFFLAHAAIDAWGQPNRILIYGLTLERDVDLASFAILVALFLIRRYYELNLEPLQRALALGICFFCAIDVINNSIVRQIYTGDLFSLFSTSFMYLWPSLELRFERMNGLYGAIQFGSTMISMSIWCFALRKQLPVPAEKPVLLPAEVYRELSLAINVRLSAFNERLVGLLKP